MTSCFGQPLANSNRDAAIPPISHFVLVWKRVNIFLQQQREGQIHNHLISSLNSILTLGFLRDWLLSPAHVFEKAVWVLAMSSCQIPNRRAASRIQQSKCKTGSSECLVPFWIVKPLGAGWDDYRHENVMSGDESWVVHRNVLASLFFWLVCSTHFYKVCVVVACPGFSGAGCLLGDWPDLVVATRSISWDHHQSSHESGMHNPRSMTFVCSMPALVLCWPMSVNGDLPTFQSRGWKSRMIQHASFHRTQCATVLLMIGMFGSVQPKKQ